MEHFFLPLHSTFCFKPLWKKLYNLFDFIVLWPCYKRTSQNQCFKHVCCRTCLLCLSPQEAFITQSNSLEFNLCDRVIFLKYQPGRAEGGVSDHLLSTLLSTDRNYQKRLRGRVANIFCLLRKSYSNLSFHKLNFLFVSLPLHENTSLYHLVCWNTAEAPNLTIFCATTLLWLWFTS